MLGSCADGVQRSGCIKCGGVSWLVEELSAYQEGLCSMEIVGWLVIVFSMQSEVDEDTNKHGALPQYTHFRS